MKPSWAGQPIVVRDRKEWPLLYALRNFPTPGETKTRQSKAEQGQRTGLGNSHGTWIGADPAIVDGGILHADGDDFIAR